jgi:hypothetical protein
MGVFLLFGIFLCSNRRAPVRRFGGVLGAMLGNLACDEAFEKGMPTNSRQSDQTRCEGWVSSPIVLILWEYGLHRLLTLGGARKKT